MRENATISVIIPVYNVEKYLAKCVESVLIQSYRELDILLVDDGSRDQSSEICDRYALQDPRIRVIHKENGGLSSARNAGIEAAEGELLYFLDSDDQIHPRALEWLYKNMMTAHADVSVGGCQRFCEQNEILPESEKREDVHCISGREAMEYLFDGEYREETVIACGKLYHRDIWQNLRFPLGKCHEDEYVAHHVLDQAKRVVYTRQPLYFYLMRNDSITGQRFQLRALDAEEAFRDRLLFFETNGYQDLLGRSVELYLWWIIKMYSKMQIYARKEIAIKRRLVLDYRKYYRTWQCSKLIKRMKYGAFYVAPDVVSWIWRLIKKDK